jgi:hypothetical protein
MGKQKKFVTTLDESLTRVLKDKEPIETVVAGHPEWGDQLRESLKTAQWLSEQRRYLSPRPGYIDASQRYLESDLMVSNLKQRFRYFPYRREGLMRRLSLLIVVFFLVFSGGAGLVLGGEDSLPGETLYPIKVISESISLALTLQPTKQAQLHLQFAQEHLVACAIVASQGRYEDAQIALRNYERHMARAGRLVPVVSQDDFNDSMFFVDFNQRYLQDMETIQILIPGGF